MTTADEALIQTLEGMGEAFRALLEQAIETQEAGAYQLIQTLAKTVLTSMMTLGRAELAKTPDLRPLLTDRSAPPTSRLLNGLWFLAMQGLRQLGPTEMTLLRQRMAVIADALDAYFAAYPLTEGDSA